MDVYGTKWSASPRWWTEDLAAPDDAPADLVVVLKPRPEHVGFAGVAEEPRIDTWSDAYLFASETRRLGPEPGMLLTTRVRRGPSNELVLKSCGPGHYEASLDDFSPVAWKDTIRLRVLRVDHAAKRLVGEFVEKVD